jgi:hypothetical protein
VGGHALQQGAKESGQGVRINARGNIAVSLPLGDAGPSTGVSTSGWNEALAINLTGSFLGAKH